MKAWNANSDARAERARGSREREARPVARRHRLARGVRRGGRRPEALDVAQVGPQEPGRRERHAGHERRAVQADDADDGRRQDRPERPAAEPADGEHAHAGALAPAGSRDVAREAHRLGVVHRDPDRRDDERAAGREVVVELPRERDAGGGEDGADRHHPARADAVGERAEQRLQERRADAREQQQRAGRGVAVAALRDEERQQRGHGALRQVDAQVAEREHPQSAAVEPQRHGHRDRAHRTPRLTG